MEHLLVLSGLFLWGACAPRQTALQGEWPMESAVVTLNGSCREQSLQRVGSTLLRRLRLDRPPQMAAAVTGQVREVWAKVALEFPTLSHEGLHLNISSNETLLIRRGSCTQISHRVTLEDLDWAMWVLHPTSFVFTECLGCHCRRKEEGAPLPLWIQECGLGQLPGSGGSVPRRCCRSARTPLTFTFLTEDGSLVLRVVHMDQDCHCRP